MFVKIHQYIFLFYENIRPKQNRRGGAGQDRALRETVVLDEIAEIAIARVHAAARERQIVLSMDKSSDVGAAIGAGAAALVLVNLLDNAIKFTPAARASTMFRL